MDLAFQHLAKHGITCYIFSLISLSLQLSVMVGSEFFCFFIGTVEISVLQHSCLFYLFQLVLSDSSPSRTKVLFQENPLECLLSMRNCFCFHVNFHSPAKNICLPKCLNSVMICLVKHLRRM